jgi:hypothetical protein
MLMVRVMARMAAAGLRRARHQDRQRKRRAEKFKSFHGPDLALRPYAEGSRHA